MSHVSVTLPSPVTSSGAMKRVVPPVDVSVVVAATDDIPKSVINARSSPDTRTFCYQDNILGRHLQKNMENLLL